jgi:peptide/nickel transport system ATP-binding protein
MSPNRPCADEGGVSSPLLQVDGLHVQFRSERALARAVEGVSFDIRQGEVLGLVGESGCGKTVTALSLLRLLPPTAQIEGRALFAGDNLLSMKEPLLRRLRGHRIAMVFQDPMTSLNPTYTVGEQIAETLRVHLAMSRACAAKRCRELLDQVGIPNSARVFGEYPHHLSGGMRQRVMIAIAIACGPKLLVADEPTTALDVTIQAQILDLLLDLQRELRMAVLLISHDLGVVAEVCNRVAVMYAGRIVEQAPTRRIFARPSHPYTRGLLDSIPRLRVELHRLKSIPGSVPSPDEIIHGCRFAGRCPGAFDRCALEPDFISIEPEHLSRCWLADGVGA